MNERSIWGAGDKETLELLKTADLGGVWLNLAAGDGRYNSLLLKKTDSVTATDVDDSALKKLVRNTPDEYRNKLKTFAFDLTGRFPFQDKTFDGIFCTGTLHLFNKKVLFGIFSEIKRVLRTHGKIILDFATDIKRRTREGTPVYMVDEEPTYTLDEAVKLLEEVFEGFKTEIHECAVPKELVNTGEKEYEFECNYVLLVAER